MDLQFWCPLFNIDCESKDNQDVVLNGLVFSPNNKFLHAWAIEPETLIALGFNEVDDIRTRSFASLFAKCNIELPSNPEGTDISEINANIFHILNHLMKVSRVFLIGTWLVKDNAIDFDRCHFQYNPSSDSTNSYPIPKQVFTNKLLLDMCTMADGTEGTVQISSAEFADAKNFFQTLLISLGIQVGGSTRDEMENGSRIQRAIRWIDTARARYWLSSKIALYWTALESLVATNTEFIGKNTRNRVALLLGSSPKGRKKLSNILDQAYKVRCSVTHGDQVNPETLGDLPKISQYCDQIVRECFRCALMDDKFSQVVQSSNCEIDSFFLHLERKYGRVPGTLILKTK